MNNHEGALELTFEEANILFGFSGTNPATLLKALFNSSKNNQLHSVVYNEIRMLLTIIRIRMRIKNEETLYIVKSLSLTFIKEQFHNRQRISCSLLHYLLSLTWRFRNCKNLDDIAKVGYDRGFISKFREELAISGIGVQLELL